MQYEVLIGLEIHVQLKTRTKLFCGCANRFGGPPNTRICPVCLGLPGVLPVVNRKAVELAIKAALCLNCKIERICKFHRKNYFYPDLPKAYQISQYDEPLAKEGWIEFKTNGRPSKIKIQRLHLEEDAGKLLHFPSGSGIDYNRCGIPLIEIVTAPEIHSPEEAYSFLETLKSLLQYSGVSDCNMEEGSLRCDANISLKEKGKEESGAKIEVKNMNTFKGVKAALSYEIRRQEKILKEGGKITLETRLWNQENQRTAPMRTKEEVHDYRYFPDPDLLPLEIPKEWIEKIKKEIPESPAKRRERFITQYGLPPYDAEILTREKRLADFYEACVSLYPKPKPLSNWIMTEVLKEEFERIEPKGLVRILRLLDEGQINRTTAKEVFKEYITTGKDPSRIIEEKGLLQMKDEEKVNEVVDLVINENRGAVKDFQNGKEEALSFLIGQVMRTTKGKADPYLVRKLLKEKLLRG